MSLKETSERLKNRAEELKKEVKGTVEGLAGLLPRPIAERKPLLLREPLLKRLMSRRKERK